MAVNSEELCYSRISGVVFGIVLFSILFFLGIDRILRSAYNFQTGFSGYAIRRFGYEVLSLAAFIIVLAFSPHLSTIQTTAYSIGVVVSVAVITYFTLLEDMHPFLILAPWKKFAAGLDVEQYWDALVDIQTSPTFTFDLKNKLGINTNKQLKITLVLLKHIMEARYKNMSSMCIASLAVMFVNIGIFIINMQTFCDFNTNNFVIDCSSICCIVMAIACRKDLKDLTDDTFVETFVDTLARIQTKYRPMTLKQVVRKMIFLKRMFNATGTGAAIVENPMAYQFLRSPYDGNKRQNIEDVVEESVNVFEWYMQSKRETSVFGALSATIIPAGGDIRVLACLVGQAVAKDIITRACPQKGSPQLPLSLIVLAFATRCIASISGEIVDVEFANLNVSGLQELILKLTVLMQMQEDFDKTENSYSPEPRTINPEDSCYNKILAITQAWHNCKEDPVVFMERWSTQKTDVNSRDYQILYMNDIAIKDNTSHMESTTILEAPTIEVLNLVLGVSDDNKEHFNKLLEIMFEEELHLKKICRVRDIVRAPSKGVSIRLNSPTSAVTNRANVVAGPSNGSLLVTAINRLMQSMSSNKTTDTTVNYLQLPNALPNIPMVKGGSGDSFYARESYTMYLAYKEIYKKQPTAPMFGMGDANALAEHEMTFFNIGVSARGSRLPQEDTDQSSQRSLFRVIMSDYVLFYFEHSYVLNVIALVDYKRLPYEIGSWLFDWIKFVFLVPVVILFIVFGGLFKVLYSIVTLTFVRQCINLAKGWRSIETNQIIIRQASASVVYGCLAWRFCRCAIHIGEPVHNYDKPLVIAIVLALPIFTFIPNNIFSVYEWYSSILPISAIVFGGFINLATAQEDLSLETYLGLGGQYNLDDPVQTFLVPLLYGFMHCAIILFALLPLTMCRYFMLKIMTFPKYGDLFGRLLGMHDMYHQHRVLGYAFFGALLAGAILWWIAIDHACSDAVDLKSCVAFYPKGNYFDIRGAPWYCNENTLKSADAKRGRFTTFRRDFFYPNCVNNTDGNLGAVTFLREIITVAFSILLMCAEFKYPLLPTLTRGVKSKPLAKNTENSFTIGYSNFYRSINEKIYYIPRYIITNYVEPNAFEVFMYSHVIITYIVALAAFFSRFEVFYISAICWGIYVVDRLIVVVFCTHTFYFSRKDSVLYDGALKLVVKKRHWQRWYSEPGEIIFLQAPRLGPFWLGRQWHAFSLAASSTTDVEATHDSVELLIQIHGKGSWTHTLKSKLYPNSSATPLFFHVRGPFGSSFQGFRRNDFVMLIGGGSGVASSLSVLRELVRYRGSVKRCWFIYATRSFSSVEWCWKAIHEILHPEDPALAPHGFIRMSIHVSASLNWLQKEFVNNNGDLKYLVRSGRPDWKKLFRSFGAQSLGSRGIKKTKICACATKAIYANIERALVEVNDPNLDLEFSSENFE